MSITIQEKLLNIGQYCINRKDYHELINICSRMNECGACVYIYDTMKQNNIEPNEETFEILDKLHRKELIDCNTLRVPGNGNRTLAPKRRIHKIMKGHSTKENYGKALQHKQIVIDFLNKNPEIKTNPKRHWVAKQVSKNCNIDIRTVRYIITHLKRIKFIDQSSVSTNLKPLDHPFTVFLSNNIDDSVLPSIQLKNPSIFKLNKMVQSSPKQFIFGSTKINARLDKSQLIHPTIAEHIPYIPSQPPFAPPPSKQLTPILVKKRPFAKSSIQNFF